MKEESEKSIHAKSDQRELWTKSLENARSILHARDISDSDLNKILSSSKDPHKFNTLIKLVYTYTRSNPNGSAAVKHLFLKVDSSHYTMTDWIDAISLFEDWLSKKGRKTTWDMMLGYLACCTESPENKDIKHEFLEILSDMLEEHGFEG